MTDYRSDFWDALTSVRTGMLGLVDRREAHSQPMTAQFDGTDGTLWFYSRSDSQLVDAIGSGADAVFHYVGPDHDLYACLHGTAVVTRDQAVIDRFWSDETAQWFPDGKDADSVTLIRFDATRGQVWQDGPDVGEFDPVEGAPADHRAKIKF